mgnify:CR=1 FL=1
MACGFTGAPVVAALASGISAAAAGAFAGFWTAPQIGSVSAVCTMRTIGLSSLSSSAPGICSRHRRVWVLLPVPDSPRNSTAPPFRLMTDEWMAAACRATAAMLNIDHSPKRNSAGLCRSVTSVVTSGAPNASVSYTHLTPPTKLEV